MKKSLLAVAVLGAFTGAASAQSSVTLFGVVDLSGNYVENGGKGVYSLASNQLNSNRLGFRGTEDLGGGLAAGFWLEAGMANDVGVVGGSNGVAAGAAAGNSGGAASSSVMFNRRSTVSLVSKWGELRLGRDFNPSFWNTVFGDTYGANGLGQTLNVIGIGGAANGGAAYPTFARSNNSIGYFLPGGMGGLYGQFQIAAGENVPNQKYMGGRIGYAAGPFDIAGAYGVTDNGGGAANPDFKVWNLMGTWNFGVVKVYGLYNEVQWGDSKLDTYSISGGVPLGQGEFKAGYAATDAKGTTPAASGAVRNIDADNGRIFSLQYIYNLSKRTALYTTWAKIDNDGKANFQVLANGYSAAGDTSQGYNFGVRHSF